VRYAKLALGVLLAIAALVLDAAAVVVIRRRGARWISNPDLR
jgi:drug/metabolite transporter (DMT)-like permease